jgi:SAM-dependent methyltransferase
MSAARFETPAEATYVLDLGCGERPWRFLLEPSKVVGVDISAVGATPDVLADGAHLPFADASFVIVFSSQVLEHVPNADAVLNECARVLVPGGRLVMSVPFFWPLHEEPHDYCRFTSHGLRLALDRAGMRVDTIEPDCGSLTMIVVAALDLLPRWKGSWLLFSPLVLAVNLVTLVLQPLSQDRRSTLNWIVSATRRCVDPR